VVTLLTTTFFAIILILSVFVSSGFSVPLISAQSTLPPPTVSDSLPPTSSDVQGNPFYDPITGGLINEYPDSQTYPYQDPYQVPTSPTQTLPDELLSLEEQQLLSQENSVVDANAPETTISSVLDGNNALLQEGVTTISNKIVFTIQGIDDSAVTSFQCILDNIQQDPSICSTNPVVAENLPSGAHLFQISSVDSTGNADATPAIFSWNVVVSDQYTDSQQRLQLFQQQQPLLPLQGQSVPPYQTNTSPYMAAVPNPRNDNVTDIYENQQALQPLPYQNRDITL
jgi:hypothetical protein